MLLHKKEFFRNGFLPRIMLQCAGCSFFFFVVGIVDLKSKKPVGFFTGVKPPKITDVKNIIKQLLCYGSLQELFLS